MLISTKGRYALRVLLDLAQHKSSNPVPLRDIAARQEISEKYLESILKILVQNKLVTGSRGKGGGYLLLKQPDEIDLKQVLTMMEGSLAPVSCLKEGADPAEKEAEGRLLPLWKGLYDTINEYLEQKSIADLIDEDPADYYVI